MKNRPKIPGSIVLQLWNSAAGRCQFPGCFEPVWYDKLTLATVKVGEMAHIIGWSPNSPRAKEEGEKLAKDYENLLLLCKNQHKLIDDKTHEQEFDEEELRQWKQDHEARVEMLLSLSEDLKCHVITFRSQISSEIPPMIHTEDFRMALLENDKHYPSDRIGSPINLTGFQYSQEISYWSECVRQIEVKVADLINRWEHEPIAKKIALFSLAPIPLLIKLGAVLPKTVPIDVYQKSRIDGGWKIGIKGEVPKYIVQRENETVSSSDIIVTVELSGKLNRPNCFPDGMDPLCPTYSIVYEEGTPGFLQSQEGIQAFGEIWLRLQREIMATHGDKCRIHLFAAVPNAVAVQLGNKTQKGVTPEINAYELDKNTGKFFYVLTL